FFFFLHAEAGIRAFHVTGVQTCALPISVDRVAPLSYLNAVAPLEIIKLPDRKLRLVSDPIERIDDDLRRFADQMLATMYEAPGKIGRASCRERVENPAWEERLPNKARTA